MVTTGSLGLDLGMMGKLAKRKEKTVLAKELRGTHTRPTREVSPMFVLILSTKRRDNALHRSYSDLAQAVASAVVIFEEEPIVVRVQVVDPGGKSYFELVKVEPQPTPPLAAMRVA